VPALYAGLRHPADRAMGAGFASVVWVASPEPVRAQQGVVGECEGVCFGKVGGTGLCVRKV